MSYRRLARFNKKCPTNTKPPFIVFNPHSEPPCVIRPDKTIIITTIDPGIKNCAIRTAQYDPETRKSKTLLQCKIDFTFSQDNERVLGVETKYYTAIYTILEPYHHYFTSSHYIGIESQMVCNYDMLRMSQHLITYIMGIVRNNGNRPYIIEMDSRLKTQMLNAPAKMSKPERKKWATKMAIQYLTIDGEQDIIKVISDGKSDDHGDTICYEKCILLMIIQGLNKIPFPS